MLSEPVSNPVSTQQLDEGAERAAVEIVLLATSSRAEIETATAVIRSSALAASEVLLTVVLGDAVSGHLDALRSSDPSTRYVSAANARSATDAWGLNIGETGTRWVVMMSEDVRPEPGWLDHLLAYAAEHPDCVALTPSVRSGAQIGTTAAPAAGHGVCLMVSRQHLADGSIHSIDHVPQSRVTATTGGSDPRPTPPSPEGPSAPAHHQPAPGGGAPPGDIIWVDNKVHAGAATPDTRRRVHLGCGKNHIPGWLNVDGDANGGPDLVADLRGGIPLPDNSVELIYSEHLFEHCTLQQGLALFAECFRVLAPGGIIRTAMPDLRDAVRCYLDNWREQEWVKDFPYIDSPAHMLNVSVREWGHLYMYDHDELRLRLSQTGFVGIQPCEIGRSKRADLCNLETRPGSSLVIEASKPSGPA